MKQRQKYWSLSHGFQFGRKLGDWGEDKRRSRPPPAGEAEAEDAELQEAIRRSLAPARGAARPWPLPLCARAGEPMPRAGLRRRGQRRQRGRGGVAARGRGGAGSRHAAGRRGRGARGRSAKRGPGRCAGAGARVVVRQRAVGGEAGPCGTPRR